MTLRTTTPPPKATHSANDNGPLTSGQVKVLKIAIVVMGVMIIAALLAIVGRVIYLSANKPAATAESRSPDIGTVLPAPAPKHDFSLPQGSTVTRMSLEGNRLLVHFSQAGSPRARVYDLTSGKLLSDVTFTPAEASSR
jgi:hypothetical protein